MRKPRSALVLLAAVLGALFALVLPGTAMAASFETDYAVAGSVPGGLECTAITGAKICFEKDGDKWWVKDTKQDGASAVAYWINIRNLATYREGACVNSLGYNKWGVCNKNYYEDSGVYAWVCVSDLSDGGTECSDDYYVFQSETYPA